MMENDIEKLFKKALDKHELPYDKGAWESFEKKMNKSKSQSYKWWILGVAAALFSISTIYLFNKDNAQNTIQEKNNVDKENSVSNRKETVTTTKNHTNLKVNKINENLNTLENKKINKLTKDSGIAENSEIKSEKFESTSDQIVTSNLNSTEKDQDNLQPDLKTKNDNQNANITENIPTFNDKCKNETISIYNKNSFELILKTPSGREIGIEANSKSDINLKETGGYVLGYSQSNGTFKESTKFKVFGNPSLNLIMDDVISYKNGLPTINAEVNSSEENVIWKINQKTTSKNSRITEFNLFQKGSYTIAAVSKSEMGCETSEAKTIQVNEDYNLLAMSAFNPNSSDLRNSTFLPYALKERNVTFKMIVLDPDNLGIVFETTESTNPWTGIDRRDGKMVPAQKAYIWKVSLSNPEPGEKSEYKGTIVRVL
ncbi:MAG: hypothetical protein FJZ67_02310 [Bacteroidetes bacterium]|nr:hypothetical protein [Bacteroidota bacterium]